MIVTEYTDIINSKPKVLHKAFRIDALNHLIIFLTFYFVLLGIFLGLFQFVIVSGKTGRTQPPPCLLRVCVSLSP